MEIGASTVRNYPQTMTVNSITVASPTNSFNELLLNYAGLDLPLSAHGLFVSNSAAAVVLYSALNISGAGGQLVVDGALEQGEFASVACDDLVVGGPGVYNLTNGALGASLEQINGTFNHQGGTNALHSMGLLGTYRISDGLMQAPHIIPPSTFGALLINGSLIQSAGVIDADLTVGTGGDGGYTLSGGLHSGITKLAGEGNGGAGSLLQTGGTNSGSIFVGDSLSYQYYGSGTYSLSNGVVAAPVVRIGRYGNFTQSGGVHTNAGLNLAGGFFLEVFPGQGRLPVLLTFLARYTLNGGLLVSSAISLETAAFIQSGGTNQVGTLSIGSASYLLTGGELVAQQIIVGGVFHHQGGTLTPQAVVTMQAGTWDEQGPRVEVGPLQLGFFSSPGRATLLLPTNAPAVMQFADSHSLVWSNGSSLIIENWKGCVDGGGWHQILFGSDGHALTSQQLRQIQFHNPLGVRGLYPAGLLPTGELVPKQLLVTQSTPAGLELQWANGDFLQSSTNASGPFLDVPQVLSPYRVLFTDPSRFFRVREPAPLR